jgi:ankyrin repeat protein
MPTRSEATRLNLEYYRKRAKALLKAAKSGDSTVLQRISQPKLHDAQLAIAREQGFPSWPRFRAFIVQSGLDYQSVVAAFIDAAVSDLRRAEEMLAVHPNLADAGFYVALVLGNWKRVEQALKRTPTLATGPCGPQQREPLLYVCFSRFANGKLSRAADLAETARILLRYGADPNAAFDSLSGLYAASGLNNNSALTLALLEAGANPNDSESLYHSTEHPDLACMKLLLRHGATPAGENALRHILDREDLEGTQVLLAAGADPNEPNDRGETSLHWAVWRGRSAPIIAALLDGDAAPDAQRKDGRTAYALAVQSGQTEVAAILEARGAKIDLSPLDRFLGACATANPSERTYLFGIVRNQSLKRLRRNNFGVDATPPRSPESDLLRDEMEDAVARAVMELPEIQREVLILAHYEQMPLEEIAQVLDIELGAAKSRLQRARASLKETLAAYAPGLERKR